MLVEGMALLDKWEGKPVLGATLDFTVEYKNLKNNMHYSISYV